MKEVSSKIQRSERLSLRLNKFKKASEELPKLITITETNDQVWGFCITSNYEKSPYNSLIINLFRVHIHISIPEFIKPQKLPVYTDIGVDVDTGEIRKGWRYKFAIKTYGLGYDFNEKAFYLLHGIQAKDDEDFGKEKLTLWTPFDK